MKIPPQKFREIVLQALFSIEFQDDKEINELISLLMKELKTSKQNVKSAIERAFLIKGELSKIDALIGATSDSYRFERIQRIERNILRLSCYELLLDDTIPPKVAINEGIRLAKKFSTTASASFVNAILDAVHQKDTSKINATVAELEKEEEISREAAIEKSDGPKNLGEEWE